MKLKEIRVIPYTMDNYRMLFDSMKKQKKIYIEYIDKSVVVDKTDFRTWCKLYITAIMNDAIATNARRAQLVLATNWDDLPEFLQQGVVHYRYRYRYIPLLDEDPNENQQETFASRMLKYRLKEGISRVKWCEMINESSEIYGIRWTVDDIEHYECLNQSPKVDKVTAASKAMSVHQRNLCGFKLPYKSCVAKWHKEHDPDFSSTFEAEMTKEKTEYEMPPSVEKWFKSFGL